MNLKEDAMLEKVDLTKKISKEEYDKELEKINEIYDAIES